MPLRWRLTLFIALPMWMILPDDNVWRNALKIGQDVYGKAVFAGDNDYYVVALPVDPPNSPNQVIDEARVVESLKSYDEAGESLGTFRTLLATGLGAAFLLSIGGSYLLAGAALRPVDAVTSAASRMGEGDLSKRLPVANPKDEIGRLVMSIARQIAESHGGKISAESTPGKGSTFTLILPKRTQLLTTPERHKEPAPRKRMVP